MPEIDPWGPDADRMFTAGNTYGLGQTNIDRIKDAFAGGPEDGEEEDDRV